MNEVSLNIKTNPRIKKQAEKLAKEIGLSLESILNIYLNQFVTTKRLDIDLNILSEEKELLYLKEGKLSLSKGKRFSSAEKLVEECLK